MWNRQNYLITQLPGIKVPLEALTDHPWIFSISLVQNMNTDYYYYCKLRAHSQSYLDMNPATMSEYRIIQSHVRSHGLSYLIVIFKPISIYKNPKITESRTIRKRNAFMVLVFPPLKYEGFLVVMKWFTLNLIYLFYRMHLFTVF